ncbi:MAG: serine/threonine protein kinase [Cyanobacteria bacterium HKST-UBA02]|nr:serine/threonine protein kinase [Cyanobacteria bacterium HKST-UBA02]
MQASTRESEYRLWLAVTDKLQPYCYVLAVIVTIKIALSTGFFSGYLESVWMALPAAIKWLMKSPFLISIWRGLEVGLPMVLVLTGTPIVAMISLFAGARQIKKDGPVLIRSSQMRECLLKLPGCQGALVLLFAWLVDSYGIFDAYCIKNMGVVCQAFLIFVLPLVLFSFAYRRKTIAGSTSQRERSKGLYLSLADCLLFAGASAGFWLLHSFHIIFLHNSYGTAFLFLLAFLFSVRLFKARKRDGEDDGTMRVRVRMQDLLWLVVLGYGVWFLSRYEIFSALGSYQLPVACQAAAIFLLPIAVFALLFRKRKTSEPARKKSGLSPYDCLQGSFFAASLWLFFAPGGLGYMVANWLQCSLVDANITHVSQAPPALFYITATTGWLFFMYLTAPVRVRVSLLFESILEKSIRTPLSVLEAMIDSVKSFGELITLRGRSTWLKDYFSSLFWFAFVYCAIFLLVASSILPDNPLGATIWGWLSACMLDANYVGDFSRPHWQLCLFAASICAAYGAGPLAVMWACYLPNRRGARIHLSDRGIMAENPMVSLSWRPWSDLDEVETISKGKEKVLSLKFRGQSKLKVPVKNLSRADLASIIKKADERAEHCRFDAETISLKKSLVEEERSQRSETSARFESTIFAVGQAGDIVLDGAYRIVKQLATRPLSAVYLARDQKGALVVLKQFVTPDQSEKSANWKDSLKREYEILRSCQNNALARVLGIVEEAGSTYLIVEYIEGENLRQIIDRHGKRKECTTRAIALELARAVSYLHDREPAIVHRDITPDNLMIDREGRLRVIDFGAAHEFIEGVTGTLIGKQCYIAPEQLRGDIDPRSDIYSFGCSLYFLITGKDPEALKQSDPKSEGYILTDELNEIIKKCTSFEPENRIGSFEQILDILGGDRDENKLALLESEESEKEEVERLSIRLEQAAKTCQKEPI